MYLNRFEIRHDPLRRFDPRARVIAGASLALVVHGASVPVLIALLGLGTPLLRRDFSRILRGLAPLELFCALLLLQALAGLLPGSRALVLILRVHGAALVYALTVASMGFSAFAQALGALGLSPKLISILYLTHRYLYLMSDAVFLGLRAMRYRKSPEAGGLVFMWKSYAAVFASALCAALVRAESAGTALLSRGFEGRIPRTGVRRWNAGDGLLAAAGITGAVVYGTGTLITRFFLV